MPKGAKIYYQNMGTVVVCHQCGLTYTMKDKKYSKKLMDIHRKNTHNINSDISENIIGTLISDNRQVVPSQLRSLQLEKKVQ
jgi:hypothetical protein